MAEESRFCPFFFSFLLKVFVSHPARLMTDDVRGKYGTLLDGRTLVEREVV